MTIQTLLVRYLGVRNEDVGMSLVFVELACRKIKGNLVLLIAEISCRICLLKYKQMDEEVQGENRKLKKRDDEEQNQSVVSIRGRSSSNCESSSSLNRHKRSLVQVKSLEGGDSNDDIYEYYLIDDGKKIKVRSSRSSRGGSAAGQSEMEMEEPIRRRLSSSNKLLVHQCQCDDNNCLSFHCPCYNEPNQMCVVDSCCPDCLKMKIQLMQATQSKGQEKNKNDNRNLPPKCIYSNNSQKTGEKGESCTCGALIKLKQTHHEIPNQKSLATKASTSSKYHKGANLITCSCKKSHCLKKYCACFAAGKKCSSDCQCEQCQNHMERGVDSQQNGKDGEAMKAENDDEEMGQLDIDQFLQQKNYDNKMMPVSMQFEYPDLRDAYHL